MVETSASGSARYYIGYCNGYFIQYLMRFAILGKVLPRFA